MSTGRFTWNRPITGRAVLIAMLAFFGFVFAVNGALIFFALGSWSGLSNEQPFEAGRDHDRTAAAAEAQAALGWKSEIALAPGAAGGQTIEVALTGPDAAPLGGLEVAIALRRPARGDLDQRLSLSETTAGRYRAEVDFPLPGRWYVEIRARDANGPRYRMEHEIAVKP